MHYAQTVLIAHSDYLATGRVIKSEIQNLHLFLFIVECDQKYNF